MFISLFAGILAFYVLESFIFYSVNRFNFAVYQTMIRKGLYTVFVLMMLTGIMFGALNYKDWKLILEMAAAMVFIDLAVLLTPNIIKFGSAEFQYAENIETSIQQNDDRITYMNRKSNFFTKLIQEADVNFLTNRPIFSDEDYKRALKEFIGNYTDEFGISVYLYLVEDDPEDDDVLKLSIGRVLDRVENLLNFTIKDRDKVFESLNEALSYAFEGEKQAIIPIYEGDGRNFLILISANEGKIIETDMLNIINLVTIFNWIKD